MMKPPFKAFNSTKNVIHVTLVWYVHCVVCGFIKLYKHDFEVIKYIGYAMPHLHNIRLIITSPSGWLIL